jgi:mRNA-degrading endonuclease RelE of RelBE toxin-antitoxin system
MAYAVLLAPPAERQLKSLTHSVQKRIVKRLKSLRENPQSQGVKKLAGEESLYRIIYTIIQFKTRSSSSRSATAKKSTAEQRIASNVSPLVVSSRHALRPHMIKAHSMPDL